MFNLIKFFIIIFKARKNFKIYGVFINFDVISIKTEINFSLYYQSNKLSFFPYKTNKNIRLCISCD